MHNSGLRNFLAVREVLYPPLKVSPPPSPHDLYMDVQPLDFSVKKNTKNISPFSSVGSDHSDSDRCSSAHDDRMGVGVGGALNLSAEPPLHRPFWSRSSESGVSVSSESPERPMSPSGHSPPIRPLMGVGGHNPVVSAAFLSQLQHNPLLFSTLSSAFAKGKFPVGLNPLHGLDFPAHTPTGFGVGVGIMDGLSGGMGAMGGAQHPDSHVSSDSVDSYNRFREQMLAQVSATKGRRMGRSSSTGLLGEEGTDGGSYSGSECPPNEEDVPQGGKKRGGRGCLGSGGDSIKDEAYWERRRKNNEAAKRSRDARRAKEDEIAIRAAFLEQENLKLRVEVASLKSETAKLRCLLYNS